MAQFTDIGDKNNYTPDLGQPTEEELRYYQFLRTQFDNQGNYLHENNIYDPFILDQYPTFDNTLPMYLIGLHSGVQYPANLEDYDQMDMYTKCMQHSSDAFPASFNPRKAVDMPSKERVARWIRNIPIHFNGQGDCISNCFPAVVSSSGTDMVSNLADDLEIIEHQSRQITHITTANYINDREPVVAGPQVSVTIASETDSTAGGDRLQI